MYDSGKGDCATAIVRLGRGNYGDVCAGRTRYLPTTAILNICGESKSTSWQHLSQNMHVADSGYPKREPGKGKRTRCDEKGTLHPFPSLTHLMHPSSERGVCALHTCMHIMTCIHTSPTLPYLSYTKILGYLDTSATSATLPISLSPTPADIELVTDSLSINQSISLPSHTYENNP